MKIEGNVVSFELDDNNLKKLQLSLLMLNKDGDELFREFVDRNAYLAMRQSMRGSEAFGMISSPARAYRGNYEDKAKRRIEIWSHRKDFVNYNIIKSFFLAQKESSDETVKRDEMKRIYSQCQFVHPERNNEDVFIRNFRMMCSDSAYGVIFKYIQDSDTVIMNEDVKDYLNERKDLYLL